MLKLFSRRTTYQKKNGLTKIFPLFAKGPEIFAINHRNAYGSYNFDEFERKFFDFYQPRDSQEDHIRKLNTLKKFKTESILDFNLRFFRLVYRIRILTDSAQLKAYMYAVDGETAYQIQQDIKIMQHMNNRKEYTVHMAVECAREFERTVLKRDTIHLGF